MMQSPGNRECCLRDGLLRATLLFTEWRRLFFPLRCSPTPLSLTLHSPEPVLLHRPLSFSHFISFFPPLRSPAYGGKKTVVRLKIYINVEKMDHTASWLQKKKKKLWLKMGTISPQCVFACVQIRTSTSDGSGLLVRLQMRFVPRRLIRKDQWSCNVFGPWACFSISPLPFITFFFALASCKRLLDISFPLILIPWFVLARQQ